MFATDDTIVAIATPPGRGALGVVRLSGPRALEICAADCSIAATHLATAPRDVHARAARATTQRRSMKSSRRSFPRRIRTPASTSSRSARHGSPVVLHAVRQARDRGRRAARRARRVHAARVPQRQARSHSGGGGRRSDRRRDAAAGAGRVRSTRGNADRAHRRDRRATVRSDRAARGVARFSGRGLSLRRAGATQRREITLVIAALDDLLADAAAGE